MCICVVCMWCGVYVYLVCICVCVVYGMECVCVCMCLVYSRMCVCVSAQAHVCACTRTHMCLPEASDLPGAGITDSFKLTWTWGAEVSRALELCFRKEFIGLFVYLFHLSILAVHRAAEEKNL